MKGYDIRKQRGHPNLWIVEDAKGVLKAKIYDESLLAIFEQYDKLVDACLGGSNQMLLLEDLRITIQKCQDVFRPTCNMFQNALDPLPPSLKSIPDGNKTAILPVKKVKSSSNGSR